MTRGWALCAALLLAGAAAAEPVTIYVGTSGKAGIHRVEMDDKGQLKHLDRAADVSDATFLALSPDGRFLYAVGESNRQPSVAAFAVVAKTRALKPLNREATGGAGPCHVAVSPDGKLVLSANYGDGTVSAFPVADGGALKPRSDLAKHGKGSGVDPKRQATAHAHWVGFTPDGQRAVAVDLGCDKLFLYRPTDGKLAPAGSVACAPGSGPRHLAWHPEGKYAFVINELNSTMTVFRYDPVRGTLTPHGSEPMLPASYSGLRWASEVAVHPSGRFVYGANRGHDSITAFLFDAADGKLRTVGNAPCGGKTPRHFAIDPTGKYLVVANQGSNALSTFRIDAAIGALTPTGATVTIPKPMCVRFYQPAKVAAADRWEKDIAAFEANDRARMPPAGGVVFVGSSSIRAWDLKKWFPDHPEYLNRGFGGSQLSDAIRYADRIVTPYKPHTVVLYAGDNDLTAAKSPERIRDDYRSFVAAVRAKLPEARIVYIAIKPSPSRWKLAAKAQEANRLIRAAQADDKKQAMVDMWADMLGPDGQPRQPLYRKDKLHLSDEGYALWTGRLKESLAQP